MATNPLRSSFHSTVAAPLAPDYIQPKNDSTALVTRCYQAFSLVFSAVGNGTYYRVAASFVPPIGPLLGGSEVCSYFCFRLKNFDDLRQLFLATAFQNDVAQAAGSWNWKGIAQNVTATVLGLLAQYPLLVLVYYGNGENWAYPIICGICESSFTILSLMMSFRALNRQASQLDPEMDNRRKVLEEQIDRFLEKLPSRYKDSWFLQTRQDDPNEDTTQALLRMITQAKGLPKIEQGPWNGKMAKVAQGMAVFFTAYITTVNGAVAYRSIRSLREDLVALAIITTIFVSLANLFLLYDVCSGSAISYCEGVRDVMRRQLQYPLAHAVSSKAWYAARAAFTALSWLSCGTTGVAASYIPKADTALAYLAPISATLILYKPLSEISDALVLWSASKTSEQAKRFRHLDTSLREFQQKLRSAPPATVREFLEQFPGLDTPQRRPHQGASGEMDAPLLDS